MLNKTNFTKKHKNGFTFIEVLTVVLILGVLAAIALPTYHKYMQKSRLAQAVNLLHIVKDKQVAAVSKSINKSYINSVSDLGRLTSNSKEVLEGEKLFVNDSYTLTLNNEKQCAVVDYTKGNSSFSVAIAYDKPGLGCSGSVCKGFEEVLGEVDSVCTPTVNPTPDCEYTACDCGYIWSYDKCECLKCPACAEGEHFTCSGCKCEPDDPVPPTPPDPPEPPIPTCQGTCVSDERRVCSFDENCNCNCQCKGEYPISINNGQECSTCQETCGESYINWDSDSGKCSSCGEGSEVVNGECWACPEGTHWVADTTTDGINSDLCIGPRGHCEQDCTGQACCKGETVYDPSDGECKPCSQMYPAHTEGNHWQEGRPIWVNGTCKPCYEIDPSTPAYGVPYFNQASAAGSGNTSNSYDPKSSVGGSSSGSSSNQNPTCLSCYDKYGSERPFWHSIARYCMPCVEAFPGKVQCPAPGSGYASLPKSSFSEYLTDYIANNTQVDSYAIQTGALLASSGTPGYGNDGVVSDPSVVDDPNNIPVCGSINGISCTTTGYNIFNTPCNASSFSPVAAGNGSCYCEALGMGQFGWACNNLNLSTTSCTVGRYSCSVGWATDCTDCHPNSNVSIITWDNESMQGSCADTWHGATIEPVKPYWNKNTNQCEVCPNFEYNSCENKNNTNFPIYDSYTGKVWNGEKCVYANSEANSLPRCYEVIYSADHVTCSPNFDRNGNPFCTYKIWYRTTQGDTPVQPVYNLLHTPSIREVKRTAENKAYHAVKNMHATVSYAQTKYSVASSGPAITY